MFADLLPRPVNWYALEALAQARLEAVFPAAESFLTHASGSERRSLATVGMGEVFASTGSGMQGCGLTIEGELIALAAFPAVG